MEKKMSDKSNMADVIAEAVADINTMSVAMGPAVAMGSLYQTMAFSMGVQSMNTVFALQQAYMAQNSATYREITEILSAPSSLT